MCGVSSHLDRPVVSRALLLTHYYLFMSWISNITLLSLNVLFSHNFRSLSVLTIDFLYHTIMDNII